MIQITNPSKKLLEFLRKLKKDQELKIKKLKNNKL